MEDVLVPIFVAGMLFIGLPWIILHYVSKWKTSASLTTEDENLLDELHELARRLDDRMGTIERIVQAENPNWRSIAYDPATTGLDALSRREFDPESIDQIGRSNQPRRRNS